MESHPRQICCIYQKKRTRHCKYRKESLREEAEGILEDSKAFIKSLKHMKYDNASAIKAFWESALARGRVSCNPLVGWDIDALKAGDLERFLMILRMIQQNGVQVEELEDEFLISRRTVERELADLVQGEGLLSGMVPEKERIIENNMFGFGFSIHPFLFSLNLTQLWCLFHMLEQWVGNEENLYRGVAALLGSIFWQQSSPYAKERLKALNINEDLWDREVYNVESEVKTARRGREMALMCALKNGKDVVVKMRSGAELKGRVMGSPGYFELRDSATGELISLDLKMVQAVELT